MAKTKRSKRKVAGSTGDNASLVVTDTAMRLDKAFDGKRDVLAKLLGWSEARIDNFLDKRTPNPWAFLAAAPKIALALGEKRVELVQRIVNEFVPSAYPVAQRLAGVMGNKGLLAEQFAPQLGMRLETFLRLLNGAIESPPDRAEAPIAEAIGMSVPELKHLLKESRNRRRFPTLEVGSAADGTPICELIYELCEHEGTSPTEFAAAHHFTPGNIRDMLVGDQPAHVSPDFVSRLALALQVTDKQVIHGIKRNVPMPPGPHPAVIKRMQERVDKVTVPGAANEIGINRATLTRILQTQNLSVASATTAHAVRKWLGMGWTQFVELARVKDRNLKTLGRRSLTSAMPEEDAEVSLLKYWRKAPEDRRAAALELLMGVSV